MGKRGKEEKEGKGREGGEICNEMGLNKKEKHDLFCFFTMFSLWEGAVLTSPILHAPRDNISRKGNPSLR